ncbi:MAG: hypothetical protein AAF493_09215 [Pseudomonadota bacterium]
MRSIIFGLSYVAATLALTSALTASGAQPCDKQTESHCESRTPTTDRTLPADAKAEVKELEVHMRFFIATGFHKNAEENRVKIVKIYEKHGVSVPTAFSSKN